MRVQPQTERGSSETPGFVSGTLGSLPQCQLRAAAALEVLLLWGVSGREGQRAGPELQGSRHTPASQGPARTSWPRGAQGRRQMAGTIPSSRRSALTGARLTPSRPGRLLLLYDEGAPGAQESYRCVSPVGSL